MKTIKKDVVYLVIIAITILLLLKQCNSTADAKREKKIADLNLATLNDTVRIVKNRAGELQSQKSILIADKDNLKNLNAELSSELKKQKGTVFYLQKTVIELKNQPPISIHTVEYVYPNGSRALKWSWDTTYSLGNSRSLAGESVFRIDTTQTEFRVRPLFTKITHDDMKIKLITGLKKDKDRYEIFIKSDYPGFTVTDIDGAFIPTNDPIFGSPPKPKRFGLGLNLGPGIYYNPLNKNINVGIGVQIGLQYNFIKF